MAKSDPTPLFPIGRRPRPSSLPTELLEMVFEASYDGIYITDGNAVTIMVNKSYETISGLRRQDVMGKSMQELVKKQIISQSGTLLALERRESVTLEQIFRTGKHAIITSAPIFDRDKQPVMVVTNVRDVTELYTLKEQLEKSNESNRLYLNELESLRRQVGQSRNIVAQDPAMREVLRIVDKVAGLDATVLLVGESGAGKRQLAQYIVGKSRRKKERFVEVNCSAYAPGTLEGELFGYAPKGAEEGSRGLLELTNGGTVLLSEISELPPEVQTRLVRLMQTHQLERVGSMESVQVDVRILASTSRDLKTMVDERLFREDLYYRLNVFPIQVLPLRERRGDILPLVQEMCGALNKKYRQKKKFSQEALLALCSYDWPGNLRELGNVVERAMILCGDENIELRHLPIQGAVQVSRRDVEAFTGPVDLRRLVEEMELTYIRRAYQKYGNVRDAAKSLSMDPSTFVRNRKKLEEKGLLQK